MGKARRSDPCSVFQDIDDVTYKLGKQPARHDPRTYRLDNTLHHSLIHVPPTVDWSHAITYDMNGNDRFGDCAFASQAALILTMTTHAQAPIRLSEKQVLENYAQATGFDPDTGANDNGTVLLDALNMWRRTGFVRPGQPGRDYLTAFGALTPQDHGAVRRGICALGGLYVGLQVPRYIMQVEGDWTFEAEADWTPVGGHCVAAVGYDDAGLRFLTWGGTRHMEWSLWDRIVDECWGLVSRQNWLEVEGLSPFGENVEDLIAEIRQS